jgi:hypothetical protein
VEEFMRGKLPAGPRPAARTGRPSGREEAGTAEIGYLLARFMRGTTLGRSAALEALAAGWQETVGPEIAAETRVASYREGTLRIEVRSSALLQELSTFYRDALLAALRAKDGCLRAIEFKPGVF